MTAIDRIFFAYPFETSSQRGRTNTKGGDDHISNLSDDIICDILTLLPIKEAVRTSVLSKSWESKWTFLENVKISGREFLLNPRNDKELFLKFVDRTVSHLQYIRNFILLIVCPIEFEMSRVAKWISSVSRHNIESFELIVCYEKVTVSGYQYPIVRQSLLNRNSLKILKLAVPCTFKVDVSNCCANLTSLRYYGAKILNEYPNTDTLIFNFPVLHELELSECKWLNVKFVEINAPSLTTFICLSTEDESDDNREHDYWIKIIGARLEEFVMCGSYPENVVLSSSTVAFAFLNCCFVGNFVSFEDYGLQIRKLLRELLNLKYLTLTGIFGALTQTKFGGLPLPWFLELESLSMYSSFDVEGLLELLHATPNLKCLEFFMEDSDPFDYDDAAFLSVPSCFAYNLEKIKLDCSRCLEELNCDLTEYLLEKGIQLKNVYVRGSLDFPTNEIIHEISTFQKGSNWVTFEPY